jgi:hypothetical protein
MQKVRRDPSLIDPRRVNQAGVTQLDAARRSACPGLTRQVRIYLILSSFVDRAARVRQRTRELFLR